MTRKQKKNLTRIIVTAVLLIVLAFLPIKDIWNGWLRFALYLIAYAIIGFDVLAGAVQSVISREPFDEKFLMAVATVGAWCLGDYTEACAVMLFYQVGELFQSIAVGKSRKSITELMDIRPDYANIEQDGQLVKVDPDEVAVGSIIVVRPGEKVPIDGVVTEGSSSLDTSALTGESLPRSVSEGDGVISGCINQSGLLHIQTTKKFGESTASKILDLVENSGMKKSKSENFITKFARIYTPAVCYAALALAVLPPVIRLIGGYSPNWSAWVMRALTFLVISCPCALVISIPLSFFAGIGGASREGILVKGSNYLETLAKTKTVVMDKTGTLTKGTFEVADVHMDQMDELFKSKETSPIGKVLVREALLEMSALAESHSSHPISRSLRDAYTRETGKELDQNRVTQVNEYSGFGLEAEVDGHKVLIGNHKLMEREGISCDECRSVGTIVHVAIDGRYAGHIVISDVIKPTSAKAIADMKAVGVDHIVMLTGDSEKVASSVAQQLGITEYRSSLLPADKVAEVEKLISAKPEKASLAFVGDGINDAPVLARADVGIAMGALGSDAAIEAADVVLMDDNPDKISRAIRIARKCMRIVYENIYFAIGVKLLCLVLSAFGIANMWMAVFADVGVMVIAVLNAIRCLKA